MEINQKIEKSISFVINRKQSFKSKNAPEPYQYIRLDRRDLTKKGKRLATEKFKNLKTKKTENSNKKRKMN